MKYRQSVLRDARLLKGFTKTELAAATGLSVGAVTLIEQGKAPWLKAIRTIAKYLNIPLERVIIAEAEESEDDSKPRKRKAS